MLFITTTGQAQVTTATIYGRVEDPSGAVIPGASVDVVNEATGITKTATTNDRRRIRDPVRARGPVRDYRRLRGVQHLRNKPESNLTSGQKVDLTFVLEVGATTETVSVTAEAPLLNTTSAEQDINLGSAQVDRTTHAKS